MRKNGKPKQLRKFCGPIPVSTITHFRKSVLRVSIEPKGVRVTEVLEGFYGWNESAALPAFHNGQAARLRNNRNLEYKIGLSFVRGGGVR